MTNHCTYLQASYKHTYHSRSHLYHREVDQSYCSYSRIYHLCYHILYNKQGYDKIGSTTKSIIMIALGRFTQIEDQSCPLLGVGHDNSCECVLPINLQRGLYKFLVLPYLAHQSRDFTLPKPMWQDDSMLVTPCHGLICQHLHWPEAQLACKPCM